MTNAQSKIVNEELKPSQTSQTSQTLQTPQIPQKCNDTECTCWLNIEWKQCKTYNDLLTCMIKYIKGEILTMPLSIEPYKCDDTEFINCLEKLINIGAFVVDMQPFRDEIQNNTRYRQREYLNFGYKLKPHQTLSNIMDSLNSKGIYYMVKEFYRCNNPNCTTNCSAYYQTDYIDNINFDNDEIWISKQQKLKSKIKNNSNSNNTKNKAYKKTMHISMPEDIQCGYDEFNKLIPNFYDNLLIFNVWNNIWDRVHNRYMIDKVIECLE